MNTCWTNNFNTKILMDNIKQRNLGKYCQNQESTNKLNNWLFKQVNFDITRHL